LSRTKKLREKFERMMEAIERSEESGDYAYCPLINTDLPEEICRSPKRLMDCPTDSFCCKDCPEFGDCDALCDVATEITQRTDLDGKI